MKENVIYKGFYELVIVETDHGPREVVKTSDSVSLLLYDMVNQKIILVKQKREAMIREDNPEGFITETAAGRFDVNLSPKALMVKEAKEELGVTLAESRIELLNAGQPLALSAGVITERCYLGFAEATPVQIEQAERAFGVDAGENIKRIYVSVDDLENYICEDVRVFALIQYLLRKLEKENKRRRER